MDRPRSSSTRPAPAARRLDVPDRPAEHAVGSALRGLVHALGLLRARAVELEARPGAPPSAGPPGREDGRVAVVCAARDLLSQGGAGRARAALARGLVVVAPDEEPDPERACAQLREVLRGAGAARVQELDALDLSVLVPALRDELAAAQPRAVLLRAGRAGDGPSRVDAVRCNRCGACLRLRCPAISERELAMEVDEERCRWCGLCRQVCRSGALAAAEPRDGACAPLAGRPTEARRPEADRPGPALGGSPWVVAPASDARGGRRAGRITRVVLAGVVGQPVVEGARALAGAALAEGLAASVCEEPQPPRSAGATAVHVRLGGAEGPLLAGAGEADVLVALEPVEALRAAHLLAPRGFAVVFERVVPTWRMRARLERAPDAERLLRELGATLLWVRREDLAGAGADGLLAAALLGAAAPRLPLAPAALTRALAGSPRGPERRRAFARGLAVARAHAAPAGRAQPPRAG